MIPVSAIEYVNVRITGYHSRLLSRDTYEDLLVGDNLGALTTFLLDQPYYRENIGAALEGLPEREGLEVGIVDHFIQCISDVRQMASGKMRPLFDIALTSFDLKNLKVVILAIGKDLPFQSVRNKIVPCGPVTRERIAEMFSARDINDLSSFLSVCCPQVANAYNRAVHEAPGKEPLVKTINRMEMNLYAHILKLLDTTDSNARILRSLFRYEIDLKNITSAFKFIWEGTQPGKNNFDPFIPGGTLTVTFLKKLSQAKEIDEALEMLEYTQFHGAVEKGLIYFAETGFLHEMERFFEEVFIDKTQMYRRFHPFGIGVFLSYVWAHFIEVTNLRTIINGIAFKTGAGQIRKGLIYV